MPSCIWSNVSQKVYPQSWNGLGRSWTQFLLSKRIVINIHSVAGNPEKQLRVFSHFKGEIKSEALLNLNPVQENTPVLGYLEIAWHALTSFLLVDYRAIICP